MHNIKEILTPTVYGIQQTLRGIVCDNPDISVEQLIIHLFSSVIDNCYKRDITSIIEVLGMLELLKADYQTTVVQSYCKQAQYDNQ